MNFLLSLYSNIYGFNALGLYTSSDQDCERGTYAQGRFVGPSEIKVCPSIRNEGEVRHSSEGLLHNNYYIDDMISIKVSDFHIEGRRV